MSHAAQAEFSLQPKLRPNRMQIMIATRLRQWLERTDHVPYPQHPSGRLQALDAEALLAPFDGDIVAIRARVGVPPQYWQSLYQRVFSNYARLVQRLPASESHHHAGLGGLLQHGLEVTQHTLDLKQGVMLPPAAAPEDQAMLQDLWTYACVTAALLHDLGKPVTDLRITMYDGNGKQAWSAIQGPMPTGVSYRIAFNSTRVYRQHERLPPLLAHHLIPATGLQWLASDPDVLQNWLATIQGDLADAEAIGAIVGKADGLSVARNLSGNSHVQLPAAKTKPLVERLMTGLRYILDNAELALNRRGAAGYLDGDTLWLVSKTVLDKLRTHLIEEGQTGIPSRNDRLMDELQQHGLLVPNGDRAIWHCEITLDDWQHQLTCLRLEAHRIWSDATRRPESMSGHVKPIDAATDDSESNAAVTEASEATAVASTTSRTHVADFAGVANTKQDHAAPDDLPLPFDVTASPGGSHETATENTSGSANVASAESVAHSPADGATANDPQADGQVPGMDATADAGERFVAWLKQSIEDGTVPINMPEARIHVLPEGLALVSPRIFRDFDSANWSHAQKRFQKLKLHQKTSNDENIWTCQVDGGRKQAILKIILIPNATTTLGVELPGSNTAVTLLKG